MSDSVIQPYEQGWLEVGQGHQLYWERCGTPGAKPAVFLHGGPGSGCTPGNRRFLDPARYDVLLFDQRGCGRSRPNAAQTLAALENNTLDRLVADIERLRALCGVERWLVGGGSWGTTLALAYGAAHPRKVTEMILVSIGTTTRREVAWITRDAGRFFPEDWDRFREGLPEDDLASAYATLLADPATCDEAAARWCAWEDAHMQLEPLNSLSNADPDFRRCFARLVTHYWSHASEAAPDVRPLSDVPAVLIHGLGDLSSPPDVPWRLAQAWPAAELILIDEGHGGGPKMAAAIASAADRFASAAPANR
jgi:proline iminopeptidase